MYINLQLPNLIDQHKETQQDQQNDVIIITQNQRKSSRNTIKKPKLSVGNQNSSTAIVSKTKSSKEKKDKKTPDPCCSRAQFIKISLLLLYATLCIGIVVLFYQHPSFQMEIVIFMRKIAQQPLLIHILVLVLIGSFFIIVGLPLSLFELVLGYTTNSLLIAFLIDVLINLTAFLFCYTISNFICFNMINNYIDTNIYLKAFFTMVRKNPFRNLILLRLLSIPVFIKNYVFPLFSIHIVKQICALLCTCTLHGFQRIYIGYQAQQLNSLDTNKQDYRFILFLITLNFLIFLYLFFKTRSVVQQIKRDYDHEQYLLVKHNQQDNQYFRELSINSVL